MMVDSEVAKDCYERTLSFVADASEMHSIYLRLASIYLQEEQVTIIITLFQNFLNRAKPWLDGCALQVYLPKRLQFIPV